MPKSCKVRGCTNHNLKTKNISYHQFPTNPGRLRKWVTALNVLNRDGTPWWPKKPHNIHVCSEHFVEGTPNNDPRHVDFVPSLLPNRPQNTPAIGKKKVERLQRAKRRMKGKELLFEAQRQSYDSDEDVQDGVIVLEDAIPFAATESLSTGIKQPTNIHLSSPQLLRATPVVNDHVYCKENIYMHEQVQHLPIDDAERTNLLTEIENLRSEKDQLKTDLRTMQMKLKESTVSSEICFQNDISCKYYTGISSDVLQILFQFCMEEIPTKKFGTQVSPADQLIICLVRLRHNIPMEYLARQKGISTSTASEIFTRWIDILHTKIGYLVRWPDRDALISTLPYEFRSKFPRLTGIADCFEIFIERPRSLEPRAQCYSNYKHHSTVKIFIVCSPLGCVSYLSSAWGGRSSDVEIVRKSGFINASFHLPGDQILVDRGFTLSEEFACQSSVELLMPAFTKGKKQLSAEEVERSRKISSVRIHIERIIGLIRNRYRILKGPLKISDIKSVSDEADNLDLSRIDKIVKVCGSLTNLGDGIIPNK